MESMCYTYILKCSDGTYYTGWTNDLDKRLKAHNGGKSGAKYTRSKEKENLIKEKNMQQKGSQDTKRGSEQNQNL